MQSKNWFFTLNNPINNDVPSNWKPDVIYAVWQLESGANGTPHLQGYIRLRKRGTLYTLKKLEPSAHWETRKGSHEQAKAYCTKEETRQEGPWSYGREPKPGTRSDLLLVKRDIERGQSLRKIMSKHFALACRYFKFFQAYQMQCMKPRYAKPEILIAYGPSGTGKTRACREAFGSHAYWKPKNKWWDGYGFESTVIFDEFYGWLEYDLLLRVLDWYPLIMETKGSSLHFQSKRFVFTTNVHPSKWYSKISFERLDALRRRIAEFGTILYFDKPGLTVISDDGDHCCDKGQPKEIDWETDPQRPPGVFHSGPFLEDFNH